MSQKLVHSFGHLAENLVFRHLALIEKLRLWSPRAERKKVRKRGDERRSFPRGDQSCALIFETFLALLDRRSRVGKNEFHH